MGQHAVSLFRIDHDLLDDDLPLRRRDKEVG